jgi:hypothetical protein
MAAENDALSLGVQRVLQGRPISVKHTVAENDALNLDVQRVLEARVIGV